LLFREVGLPNWLERVTGAGVKFFNHFEMGPMGGWGSPFWGSGGGESPKFGGEELKGGAPLGGLFIRKILLFSPQKILFRRATLLGGLSWL